MNWKYILYVYNNHAFKNYVTVTSVPRDFAVKHGPLLLGVREATTDKEKSASPLH